VKKIFGSDDNQREQRERSMRKSDMCEKKSKKKDMGIGAGGKIKQKVNKDTYGPDFWDQNCFGRVFVHIVDSMEYEQITGEKPPNTPVTAKAYSDNKFPWFDLYEERIVHVAPSDTLSNVKTVKEIDQGKRLEPQQDDNTVTISAHNVVLLK